MFIVLAIVLGLVVQHVSTTNYTCFCECPAGSNEGIAYPTEESAEACVQACQAVPSNPCDDTNTYACLGTNCTYSDSYNHSIIPMSIQNSCACQCPNGSAAQACIEACNTTLEINRNEDKWNNEYCYSESQESRILFHNCMKARLHK